MINSSPQFFHKPLLACLSALLIGCGGGGSDSTPSTTDTEAVVIANTEQDDQLRALITDLGLTGDPSLGRNLPSIEDPLPQLGKLLFFSKSLGGSFDSACVTCHHPTLGGADSLSLPVGVNAVTTELLGVGREHSDGLPPVPRNSPTVFNVGLWDTGLFWDSRVESLGQESGANGADSGIRTPDSSFGVSDVNAGANLATAQVRFPITSDDEMKTAAFENGSDNDTIRAHLSGRVGNYGTGAGELSSTTWLSEFQTAFDSTQTSENLISFDNIATAIGEYERSMVFIDSPWKAYVEGDNTALSDQQKSGAIIFFSDTDNGGAGCANCHKGDLFSDGSHQTVAFPQIGPGKGDGNSDDFGRERESGDAADRYRYRVPSLLNVEHTAPYGHTGAYATLQQVMNHYDNPRRNVGDFFDDGGWCQLAQFNVIDNCEDLYPNAADNSELAIDKLEQEQDDGSSLFNNINTDNDERDQLVAFLQALTDPCIEDRDCLEPWIADNTQTGPDAQQLNAVDQFSEPL